MSTKWRYTLSERHCQNPECASFLYNYQKQFCSNKCSGMYHRKPILSERLCQNPECHNFLYRYQKRFCSKKCTGYITTTRNLMNWADSKYREKMVELTTKQLKNLAANPHQRKLRSKNGLGKKRSPSSREKQSQTLLQNFINGKYKKYAVSKSELLWGQKIQEFFKIDLIHSYWLGGKCFDYKHPTKNILFEIDGAYWHNLKNMKENDKLKTTIAEKNGFQLYRFSINNIKEVVPSIEKEVSILKEIL